MTSFHCPTCSWTYDTTNHTEDEMPPQAITILPPGVPALKSNLVTTLYCPACIHTVGHASVYGDVPEAIEE